MACQCRILKLLNVEIFLYFTDISDMREKSLHITDIKVFCGITDSTFSGKDKIENKVLHSVSI